MQLTELAADQGRIRLDTRASRNRKSIHLFSRKSGLPSARLHGIRTRRYKNLRYRECIRQATARPKTSPQRAAPRCVVSILLRGATNPNSLLLGYVRKCQGQGGVYSRQETRNCSRSLMKLKVRSMYLRQDGLTLTDHGISPSRGHLHKV